MNVCAVVSECGVDCRKEHVSAWQKLDTTTMVYLYRLYEN